MIEKRKWEIYPFQPSLMSIPIKMTIIAIVISQVLMIIFVLYSMDNPLSLNIPALVILLSIDIYFMRNLVKAKNKEMKFERLQSQFQSIDSKSVSLLDPDVHRNDYYE